MFNIFFLLIICQFYIELVWNDLKTATNIYIYIYNTHAYCNDCTHKYDVQFKQESPESPE